MGFLDRLKDSVSMAGAGVSQKVSYTADTMKLNNQIRNNEKALEKLTYQVGLKCVELHLGDESGEYEELFVQIRKLRAENDVHREEINRLSAELEEQERLRQQELQEKQAQREQERREREELARQQKGTVQDAEFEDLKEGKSQSETLKVCPKCGKQNDLDAMFCVFCGSPYATEEAETEVSAEE